MREPGNSMIRLRGVVASPGIAMGRIFLLDREGISVPWRPVAPDEIDKEQERFERALSRTRGQIQALTNKVEAQRLGSEHAYILEAHLLMLEDPEFLSSIGAGISQGYNAEWALKEFQETLRQTFAGIDDAYFQERGSDVDQVIARIQRNLLGRQADPGHLPANSIVVAHDLSPADTAELGRGNLRGFVTSMGGRTSHVAILARAMSLPALVGIDELPEGPSTGDECILDGRDGYLIIRPTTEVVEEYRLRRRSLQRLRRARLRVRHERAVTRDGTPIALLANLDLPDDLDQLDQSGAEGVGLYRTEYLFLGRAEPPTEEEQYEVYARLARHLAPRPLFIRTFDLGADKVSTDADVGVENPALGFRAVRYCLSQPELFTAQLRASLRASAHGQVRILIPMITSLEEIRQVKALVAECRNALRAEGVLIAPHVPLGIMIETPAAAILSDLFASEVDFFSLGTNDLIQYTLAVDRLESSLNYLYQPLHPAVLRLVRQVVESAHRAGIEVSVCGEMAGELLFSLALVGLGLRSLSVSPGFIPEVKEVLRAVRLTEVEGLMYRSLSTCRTAADVEKVLREGLEGWLPHLFVQAQQAPPSHS